MWVNGKTQAHADSLKAARRCEDGHAGWKCVWKFEFILKRFHSTSSDQIKRNWSKKKKKESCKIHLTLITGRNMSGGDMCEVWLQRNKNLGLTHLSLLPLRTLHVPAEVAVVEVRRGAEQLWRITLHCIHCINEKQGLARRKKHSKSLCNNKTSPEGVVHYAASGLSLHEKAHQSEQFDLAASQV